MPQTIARMYHNQETATAVATELRGRGIGSDSVRVIGPSTDAAPESALASITAAGVAPSHAKIYAEGLARGEALVVVNPPFGYARIATDILQRHDPIAVDLPEAEATPTTAASSGGIDWSKDPAPLSAALGWRVLLSDPAPFSNWLNRPTLKPEPATSSTLEKIRQQSDDPAPLSSKLGMAVLSDNPAPLSNKLGWSLLSDKAAPLSEKYGGKVLSDDPAPLSTKFGWRLLLDDPAPLSRILGLPVLSQR